MEGHESALWERKSEQTVRDILKKSLPYQIGNKCTQEPARCTPEASPKGPRRVLEGSRARKYAFEKRLGNILLEMHRVDPKNNRGAENFMTKDACIL